MKYEDFLSNKMHSGGSHGFTPVWMQSFLFDFQANIVNWAVHKGRSAIFADCGLGKTPMQLEWARQVCEHTGGDVLILAPLAVAKQTQREGAKFGVGVTVCRGMQDVRSGINVTNYEMLGHFNAQHFAGVVIDESSILKSYSGKIRNEIIVSFHDTAYRLACTATPAPNDYMELGNHAEFLGVMSRTEMLAMFFTHDGSDTAKWRLKGHAEDAYWKWLCSWAVMIRKPSDIGYVDEGFTLPKMHMHEHSIHVDRPTNGMLFAVEAQTLMERRTARRETIEDRAAAAAGIANSNQEQWIVWCDLNAESSLLAKSIAGAVEVKGSDTVEHKESSIERFQSGEIRVLVTKASMFGFGLNLQNCAHMAFVGLSDSYEQYYQAVRRCWRFGQKRPVHVHVITAETEGAVVRNIQRKEAEALRMAENMVEHMADLNSQDIRGTTRSQTAYVKDFASGDGWGVHLGDCIEVMAGMEPASIDLSIFSPPYAHLYVYSNSERDVGNAANYEAFFGHFRFVVEGLYRVTKPGRIAAVDCMNLPAMKERDGYIGLKDFRGDLIREFITAGWIFHSEHCIWKDPLIEATRTKALGLMHKQLCKDSSMCRSGIPQYLLAFRKPGENTAPIHHPHGLTHFTGDDPPTTGTLSHERWRRYASPVWMDIRSTRTLNVVAAREDKDERHICPMSLDIIDRALELWSNEGDLVYDPFTGIGSTGFCAVNVGRRFIGSELKPTYWNVAIQNIEKASRTKQSDLFASTS